MKIVLAGYGSRGDVEPCAAVGRELLRRGHDVLMAVPPDRLHFVESAGLKAVAYGPDTREQINAATNFVHRVQDPMSALPQLVERVTQVWAEKGTALVSLAEGADLLVAGMNEQRLAANVAEFYGMPFAALHFFPARALELGGSQAYVTNVAEGAQREALGLPEGAGSSTRQVLEIQAYEELCVPEPAAEWAESGYRRPFVGSLTLDMPTDVDDEVLSWIADGPPPIYFGFGSTPVTSPAETVAVISGACEQLGERALICGGANDFTQLAQVAHTKIVNAVNHTAIFPACRAIVHHGGAGTTAAAMRAGVPMLVLWLWLDQPIWASAVSQLEVGIARPFSESTYDSLVADLHSLLATDYAARAREVATAMTKPAESVAKAADLLEDAARSA
ncbi:glycosyltransferase [Mycobacterium nebraskense]|uniref:Glycosyltransferase n=1 Tax=Mycobacterium nebraskense TaxID=244292 RepID=A0A1X2A2G6_9MYCO|nr:glycosyltransferase [Mycobacterium nebraskense]KLO35335.1 glycosyltransferase [Mycobacterium nebraskense]MBI2695049.1 glycosyltransferase [Mycobacterium nebraskense]MCV7119891.1 glycosyltransferase [Mycobacterium nebraskense]ORW35616.1 glycosyltransferase [Mycobacterium nebraskense]